MEIISVRAQPGCADAAIAFLQQAWGGGNNEIMYEDYLNDDRNERRLICHIHSQSGVFGTIGKGKSFPVFGGDDKFFGE